MFEFEKVTIDKKALIRSTYMSYDASMLQLPSSRRIRKFNVELY